MTILEALRETTLSIKTWAESKFLKKDDIASPKITTVTLRSGAWAGGSNLYSQPLTINAATTNSKIDMQLNANQIVALQDLETSLMIQNNGDGTFTAYAIGCRPSYDMSVQILITEVTIV